MELTVSGLSSTVPNAKYALYEKRRAELETFVRTLRQNGIGLESVPPWFTTLTRVPGVPPPIAETNHYRAILQRHVATVFAEYMHTHAPSGDQDIRVRIAWWTLRPIDANRVMLRSAMERLNELCDRMTETNEEKLLLIDHVCYAYVFERTSSPLYDVFRASIVNRVDSARSPFETLQGNRGIYIDELRKAFPGIEDITIAESSFDLSTLIRHVRDPNTVSWNVNAIPYAHSMYYQALSAAYLFSVRNEPISDDLKEFINGEYMVRGAILQFVIHSLNEPEKRAFCINLLDLIVDGEESAKQLLGILRVVYDVLSDEEYTETLEDIAALPIENDVTFETLVHESNLPDDFKTMVHGINVQQATYLLLCFSVENAPFSYKPMYAWLLEKVAAPLTNERNPNLYLGATTNLPKEHMRSWMFANNYVEREREDDWFYEWGDKYLIFNGMPAAYRIKRELARAEDELARLQKNVEIPKTITIDANEIISEHVSVTGGDPPYTYTWLMENKLSGPQIELLEIGNTPQLFTRVPNTARFLCRVRDTKGRVKNSFPLTVLVVVPCVRCTKMVMDLDIGTFGLCEWVPDRSSVQIEVKSLSTRATKMLNSQLNLEWYADTDFGYASLLRAWNAIFLTRRDDQKIECLAIAGVNNQEITLTGITLDTPMVDALRLLSNAKLASAFLLDSFNRQYAEKLKTWFDLYFPDNESRNWRFETILMRAKTQQNTLLADVIMNQTLMHHIITQETVAQKFYRDLKWRGAHSTQHPYRITYDSIYSDVRGDCPIGLNIPFDDLHFFIQGHGDYTETERELLREMYNYFAFSTRTPFMKKGGMTISDLWEMFPTIQYSTTN